MAPAPRGWAGKLGWIVTQRSLGRLLFCWRHESGAGGHGQVRAARGRHVGGLDRVVPLLAPGGGAGGDAPVPGLAGVRPSPALRDLARSVSRCAEAPNAVALASPLQ